MEIFSARRLTNMGLIAAIYVVATMLCSSLAYGQVQFRVSEVLMLLCYFNKDYIISFDSQSIQYARNGGRSIWNACNSCGSGSYLSAEKQGKSCSCVAFPGDIKCGDSWL